MYIVYTSVLSGPKENSLALLNLHSTECETRDAKLTKQTTLANRSAICLYVSTAITESPFNSVGNCNKSTRNKLNYCCIIIVVFVFAHSVQSAGTTLFSQPLNIQLIIYPMIATEI